jgi:prepilin-type N-terminal cleavage/methylation domain-containing protein
MKMHNSPRAFTLVELIMVIVIIGLLAAVAIPKFTDLRTEAQSAAEEAVVSAVRSGIKLAYMSNLAQGSSGYPSTLDSASVGQGSESNALFTNVIEDGVFDANWEKVNATTYEYNPTGNQYVYDNSTGKLTKQ